MDRETLTRRILGHPLLLPHLLQGREVRVCALHGTAILLDPNAQYGVRVLYEYGIEPCDENDPLVALDEARDLSILEHTLKVLDHFIEVPDDGAL
ncbi:MAG: hypothetical protein GTN93_18940 [Anaerolineae bacterium]|nr:hypothetical protein [Anaerolineae bacterium]NIQ80122.1 hypothetical protein [Anaerolineae bacterium]